MIHSISIENFFSIAEKQVINFRVPRNAPYIENFATPRGDENIRLPAVVAFYGANASGKSTTLRAIASLNSLFRASARPELPALSSLFQAYRTKNWVELPTKIVIEIDGEREKFGLPQEIVDTVFRYELHINNDPVRMDIKSIAFESLSYASSGKFKKLFVRNGSDYEFSKEFQLSKDDPRLAAITKETSLIGRLSIFGHDYSISLMKQLAGLVSNVLGTSKFVFDRNINLKFYNENPHYLQILNQELQRFDLGLEAFFVNQDHGILIGLAKHSGLDFNIFVQEESDGTQRFIDIFPLFLTVLETGGVLVLDELDSELHPLLIPELLGWFYDPERNPLKAQLLFTAHNASLLDDLEKEQVYFTEKPMGKATQIYGAKDIGGLRREPSLTKKYLSGELGAVPHIG